MNNWQDITLRQMHYVIISIVFLMLNGCGQINASLQKDGIVFCSESSPSSFNPQLDTSKTTADASAHQIYDRLIEFDLNDGTIVPGLATYWAISDDGMTYTFQLRKNVSFHSTEFFTPTRHFNAEDVVFSINRWRTSAHPFHHVSGGNYPYFDSLNLGDTIKDIKSINSHLIEISLFQRDTSFLANLASDFSVILSAEYGHELQRLGEPEKIDQYPVGTGPYKFKDYRKNHHIRFERNEQYFLNNLGAKQLVYDITPSSSLRFAKLITGECDAVAVPSQSNLEVIEQREDLTLLQRPGLNVGFWAFNTQKPPFSNSKVRRALAHAIDKNALIDAIYFGQAQSANSIIPPASWAHQSNLSEIGYNPVLARSLLDEAGFKQGFAMQIWAIPVQRAYNPNALRMAQLMSGYLEAVGIQVEVISFDWNRFRQQLSSGEHDSVLIGWSADNGDPDNFYRPLLTCAAIPSGTNRAMWCDPKYDALVQAAIKTDNLEQRTKLYHRANAFISEQVPLVPLAHAFEYQAINKRINGMLINPYGGVQFDNVVKIND